jgi:hypothetical protein
MAGVWNGSNKPTKIAVGSGCVHTLGVSEGVPFETVGFYAAAKLAAEASGLRHISLVIAPDIARANDAINLDDSATRGKLDVIEGWHVFVAKKFQRLCAEDGVKVDIIIDRDLVGTPAYEEAKAEREARLAQVDFAHTICGYSALQDLIFQVLRRDGAGIKVGWTPHTDATLSLRHPEFYQQDGVDQLNNARLISTGDSKIAGSCEVAFDQNTRFCFPNDPIAAVYIPSAMTACGQFVAPYTARPQPKTQQHGRLLLCQEYVGRVASSVTETARKSPEVIDAYVRTISAIDMAFPRLMIGLTASDAAAFATLRTQRNDHKDAVRVATKEDQKAKLSEKARTNRFEASRDAYAAAAGELVGSRVRQIIGHFGV